jgi:adenosine deaminase
MNPGPRQYAELHLHLGGAVLPRILWTFLERVTPDAADYDLAQRYLSSFGNYDAFEDRLTRPSISLEDYLRAHKIVEPLQRAPNLGYFVNRLLRGCYVFENLVYLELRYNPYLRLAPGDPVEETMGVMVRAIAEAAADSFRDYPIVFTQILCLDSRLSERENEAILACALAHPRHVAAVDLAGPDSHYRRIAPEVVPLLRRAKEGGLGVTVHCFETPRGFLPEVLDFADRIGHGIQIPLLHPEYLPLLAERGVCLEVCPTTYLRAGTLPDYESMRPIFERCFSAGVPMTVATDNSALHGVRLPLEYERLLSHGIIGFAEMEALRENAFRHAFRWPGTIDRYRSPII